MGKVKFQISCYKIFSVFIVGGFTITTGLVERSKRFGFSIVLFTTSFKVYETINFAMEGNTLLRKKQYTTEKGIKIAKQLVINKIENQRDMLKKIRKVEILDGILNLNIELEKLIKNDYSVYEIMGIEGTTAKVYFNRIFGEYDWKGRQPRVKRDKINLLLDIGYTILFNYLEGILNIYGFDIYKGNLHKEFYKRKSLVCDIIEPFRPIVDYKIRKAYNLGQLNGYNYSIDNGRYGLNWKDTENFVALILSEILNYKECIFEFVQQYYRWFMKDKSIDEFPKVVLVNDID
ncbi:MAG: type V CRISPR-associated endonuclease Cas1 [Clostridia bacterium]|nr:type V CRISPR-associated endonuclease Cas1 [Clostridia bacterium]